MRDGKSGTAGGWRGGETGIKVRESRSVVGLWLRPKMCLPPRDGEARPYARSRWDVSAGTATWRRGFLPPRDEHRIVRNGAVVRSKRRDEGFWSYVSESLPSEASSRLCFCTGLSTDPPHRDIFRRGRGGGLCCAVLVGRNDGDTSDTGGCGLRGRVWTWRLHRGRRSRNPRVWRELGDEQAGGTLSRPVASQGRAPARFLVACLLGFDENDYFRDCTRAIQLSCELPGDSPEVRRRGHGRRSSSVHRSSPSA